MNIDKMTLQGRDPVIQEFSSLRGRIGIFGGTFDPIHNGHIQIARFAADAHRLDSVIFIPNKSNPIKSDNPAASDEDRFNMVLEAVYEIEDFFVSRIELERQGPSYTVETLKSIYESLGKGSSLFFILGSDSLLSFHKWHNVEEIFGYASVIPVARRDLPREKLDQLKSVLSDEMICRFRDNFVQKSFIDISSTILRERLKKAPPWPRSIPTQCLNYIRKKCLYR